MFAPAFFNGMFYCMNSVIAYIGCDVQCRTSVSRWQSGQG